MIGPQASIQTLRGGIESLHDASGGLSTDGGFYFPANASEFATLGVTAPSNLWLCQDASGSLADTIGSKALSTGGTGQLYQQSVGGFARKGVALADGNTGHWLNTTVGDAASTSSLVALVVYLPSTPASAERIIVNSAGTTTKLRTILTNTPRLRVRANAGLASGTVSPTGATRLLLCQHDITNSVQRTASNQELVTPAFSAISGAVVAIGGYGATAPAMTCLWACAWYGAAAELSTAQLRTLYQTLSNAAVPW